MPPSTSGKVDGRWISVEWQVTPSDLLERLARLDRQNLIINPLERFRVRVIATAKTRVTGGHPLNVRTGRLRSSLFAEIREQADEILFVLGAGVHYAEPLELGATYPARTVRPVVAKALFFKTRSGEAVFAKYAHIPTYTVPPKPFLEPSMTDNWPLLLTDIRSAYQQVVTSSIAGSL